MLPPTPTTFLWAPGWTAFFNFDDVCKAVNHYPSHEVIPGWKHGFEGLIHEGKSPALTLFPVCPSFQLLIDVFTGTQANVYPAGSNSWALPQPSFAFFFVIVMVVPIQPPRGEIPLAYWPPLLFGSPA